MDYFAALQTFVRAAELKSFSRVAQELSIKTSTASRHIADLEADLKIALFNRSTRGLALTEGGTLFYGHAAQLLRDLDHARAATASLNQHPSGLLRVTMPGAFGRRHVMPWIASFLIQYPDIDIDASFTDETINLIETRVDLAIRIGSLKDASLMGRPLATQRRIACASPDYVVAHGAASHPGQLKEHACLLFSRIQGNIWYALPTSVPASSDTGADRNGLIEIKVAGRFAANDSEALLEAALSGAGIALLPTWLAGAALRAGRLVDMTPGWELRFGPESPSIWAVYPAKKTVSSKVRAFVDYLAACLGDPPYWETRPDQNTT
jgi:DNA-binding transcriptional LysR family regulator